MFLNKKILAIIPARGGSKGIKYKNLKKIKKISLIGHTSKFIDNCNFFDEKLISTDSQKIVNEALKYKCKIFKRKKITSKDFTSDFEVISEVLKNNSIKSKKFDYIVYLQPTSPFRKVSHLKSALKHVINYNYDCSWSISKIDMKFHPKKVLKIKNNKFLSIYYNEGKKIYARQQLDDIYIRNGVFYIFKISKFLKSKDIFLTKNYPSITKYKIVNIDTINDLKIARSKIK